MSNLSKCPQELIEDYINSEQHIGGWKTNTSKEAVKLFLKEPDPECKASFAVEAIREIIKVHQKHRIPDTLERLYHVEEMLRRPKGDEESGAYFDVQKKSRDHVIHALNTYLLGLLLNDKLRLNDDQKFSDKISDFDFQWELTALFHDIGYPFEIAMNLVNQSVVDPLNELIIPGIQDDKFQVNFRFPRFKKLTTGDKSLDLLHNFIRRNWELKVNAQTLYKEATRTNYVKHGVVSSLLLMAHIDLCYKAKNPGDLSWKDPDENGVLWGRSIFHEFVVPPCAAIILHDADVRNFTQRKIDKEKAPLAWMLRMADSLQDWERPKSGLQTGISADKYRIEFVDGAISFKCPEDRIGGIKRDLSALQDHEMIRVSAL